MAARNSSWTPHALLGAVRERPAFRAATALQAHPPRFAASTALEVEATRDKPSASTTAAPRPIEAPAPGREDDEPALAAATGTAHSTAPHQGSSQAPIPASAAAPETFDLPALLDQRYAEGYAEGLRQARQAASAPAPQTSGSAGPIDAQGEAAALLKSVSAQLDALSHSPERHFEPLKRLALHLAHQLVQVELTVSDQAIDGLVKRCTKALGEAHGEVVIELHPDDLALLGHLESDETPGRSFKTDATLSRGSVRVHGEHADVEDLIEHRLGLLARELRLDDAKWRSSLAAVATASPPGPVTSRIGPESLLDDAQDIAFRMTDDPSPSDPAPDPSHRA